jgi:fucose permease
MTCVAIACNLTPVYLTTFSACFGGARGLTDEQLGRIAAVFFASFVAGILVTGPLADRWGAKRFVLLGLALTCGGLCLLGLAGSYAILLISQAILGFGAGILDMVLSPIVAVLRPDRRASALNWLHSFYCTGALCTVLIGSGALYLGVPWRAVAIGMTVIPVMIGWRFMMLRVPALVHEEAVRTPVLALLTNPFFAAALTAILLIGATEQGMAQWLPAYAERALGYSKPAAAMALAGFSVGMILGRTSVAIIERRIPPVRLMRGGAVLCIVLFATASFCPYPPVALAACIAVGLAVSCLWPTTLGVTADHFPHGGASMFALLAASGNAGCVMMPWVIGVVAQHGTLNLGLATTALCPAALGIVLIRMGTGRTRPE